MSVIESGIKLLMDRQKPNGDWDKVSCWIFCIQYISCNLVIDLLNTYYKDYTVFVISVPKFLYSDCRSSTYRRRCGRMFFGTQWIYLCMYVCMYACMHVYIHRLFILA